MSEPKIDLKTFEQVLNDTIDREKKCASWMADVIRLLPTQTGYKGLPSFLREEIENIIAAIE